MTKLWHRIGAALRRRAAAIARTSRQALAAGSLLLSGTSSPQPRAIPLLAFASGIDEKGQFHRKGPAPPPVPGPPVRNTPVRASGGGGSDFPESCCGCLFWLGLLSIIGSLLEHC